jgi:hypothetical protein
MRGRVVLLVAGGLFLPVALPPVSAHAQTVGHVSADVPRYFPLAVGNRWVYERTGPIGSEQWTAAVVDRVTPPNGWLYFVLDGYFGPRRLVRATPGGAVFEFNPDGPADNLWYRLDAEVGTTWQIQLEPLPTLSPMADCVSGSKVVLARRTEVVTVPAGTFEGVVRLDFSSPCADAGIESEWFAPGVGLIRRQESSFAGPVVSQLVRAAIGDSTLPPLPYSSTLSLDRPVYVNNLMPPIGPRATPTVRGRFVVSNTTDIPISFAFSGCMSVGVVVLDEAGHEVLRARGEGGGCCLCKVVLNVSLVNDALVVPFAFKLETPAGQPLPDGRYAVAAALETLDVAPLRPSATATIEVRSVY